MFQNKYQGVATIAKNDLKILFPILKGNEVRLTLCKVTFCYPY